MPKKSEPGMTHKAEVLKAISFCIRQLGPGQLDASAGRVEKLLISATQRIAKSDFSKCEVYLRGAKHAAAKALPIVSLHIERAELLLFKWLQDRPEIVDSE